MAERHEVNRLTVSALRVTTYLPVTPPARASDSLGFLASGPSG